MLHTLPPHSALLFGQHPLRLLLLLLQLPLGHT
jgi:hypothetical protein